MERNAEQVHAGLSMEDISRLTLKEMKGMFLRYSGTHLTGRYGRRTDFYRVNLSCSKDGIEKVIAGRRAV